MIASQPLRVGVIVGSLRRGSFSRKIAKALMARAPATLRCEIIEIGDLPLYNQDLDGSPPRAWTRFRKAIDQADALLFVTPEYNRSVPGCLKNATDIGSRPDEKNHFAGRPAAIVSVSPYAIGGFGANHALRQNFVYLDMAVMQQPEAYIGKVEDLMSALGTITRDDTDAFLSKFMRAFEQWAHSARKPDEDFDTFLARREAISGDYIQGKAKSLADVSTQFDPATFFPPSGDRVKGAKQVNAANERGAKTFAKGSRGHFEVLQSGSSGGVGYWTGIQHAQMRMKGKKESVTMQLRTTEIFRVENGAWKLIHRHADMLTEK